MRSRTIPLLLLTTLLPIVLSHRPDTVPDTELRPVRPLFPEEDTTQAPITSMRYPIVLPQLPFSGEYEDADYLDYQDYPVVVGTIVIETFEPYDESSTTAYATEDPDELDAQQERLENSTIKNCTCWILVVAMTCLLCAISTFMLS